MTQRGNGRVTAVCPGSFDPITLGHLNIITRAARVFDEVIVAVGRNSTKNYLFEFDQRLQLVEDAVEGMANVRAESIQGLLTDFCTQQHASVIVKGVRFGSDFDYELQMAQMNHGLTGVETLFISTNPLYSYLSSSLVKEVATYGGDVQGLLPDEVLTKMNAKLAESAGGSS